MARPQYIYGPLTNKRDYLDWFFDRIVHGLEFVPLPLHGDQLVALTHAEDVAAMLASVVGNEHAVNQVLASSFRLVDAKQPFLHDFLAAWLSFVTPLLRLSQSYGCPEQHPDMIELGSPPQVFNCASDRYITYNGLFREVGKVCLLLGIRNSRMLPEISRPEDAVLCLVATAYLQREVSLRTAVRSAEAHKVCGCVSYPRVTFFDVRVACLFCWCVSRATALRMLVRQVARPTVSKMAYYYEPRDYDLKKGWFPFRNNHFVVNSEKVSELLLHTRSQAL